MPAYSDDHADAPLALAFATQPRTVGLLSDFAETTGLNVHFKCFIDKKSFKIMIKSIVTIFIAILIMMSFIARQDQSGSE